MRVAASIRYGPFFSDAGVRRDAQAVVFALNEEERSAQTVSDGNADRHFNQQQILFKILNVASIKQLGRFPISKGAYRGFTLTQVVSAAILYQIAYSATVLVFFCLVLC